MKKYRNELGKLHRLDGPAIEYANGTKSWYQNNQLHRLDGPAIESSDGDKYWYQNDQLHRLDGPAVEWADGTKVWSVHGKDITKEVESWLNEQRFSLPLNESAQVLFVLRFG